MVYFALNNKKSVCIDFLEHIKFLENMAGAYK